MAPRSTLDTLILVALSSISLVIAGSAPEGGSCSTNNNHIDPATHKLITDCDEKTFCSGADNGTCQLKRCRRDEFPFGYEPGDVLPAMCARDSFCPDEGNSCQNLIQVGQPCQMNRDEQCAAPPADEDFGNGPSSAICLQSTCMHANATLGQRCIIDSVTYIDIGPDGQQISNNIIRHNCQTPRFYCDREAVQCFLTKLLGSPCMLDQECQSINCGGSGVCQEPADNPRPLEAWQVAITITAVTLSMAATVSSLVVFHKRQRLRNHRDLREYYHEQLSLRQSLFQLHRSAADNHSLYRKSDSFDEKMQ